MAGSKRKKSRRPDAAKRTGRPAAGRGAAARARPAAAMRLARLDQVRVLAHPLRLRMLEQFGQAPRTAKQVAEALDEPPTRLYHHVDALARAGLIELVETRQVRGATEKYYRAAARRFEVDHAVFGGDPRAAEAGAADVIRGVVETARREALDYFTGERTPPPVPPVVARGLVHGTPAELEAVRRALMAVLERIEGGRRRTRGASRRHYAFTLLFHPAADEE